MNQWQVEYLNDLDPDNRWSFSWLGRTLRLNGNIVATELVAPNNKHYIEVRILDLYYMSGIDLCIFTWFNWITLYDRLVEEYHTQGKGVVTGGVYK